MRGVTLRWKGARFMSRSLAERLEYVYRWWPAEPGGCARFDGPYAGGLERAR
jgi:hypothetical protein